MTPTEPIQIKKYPNRRYYDATRSRHITLQEVHDIIKSGQDVSITDSRNGDDITNSVLMQILLEQDQPKLDLFPASILHMMIRSNRQVLRNWIEQFFAPFYGLFSSSQKQWDAYVRSAMQGRFMTPMDWAGSMMEAFRRSSPPSNGKYQVDDTEADTTGSGELDELRQQLAALQARLDQLGTGRENSGP